MCRKITEVNLFVFVCRLFHEDSSLIVRTNLDNWGEIFMEQSVVFVGPLAIPQCIKLVAIVRYGNKELDLPGSQCQHPLHFLVFHTQLG